MAQPAVQLLLVAFDLADRPHCRIVRVFAGVQASPTLPQQVPALVQLLLNPAQLLQPVLGMLAGRRVPQGLFFLH